MTGRPEFLRKTASLFLAGVFFFSSAAAPAATNGDLRDVENKLNSTRQKIREGDAQKARLTDEIEAADAKLSGLQTELNKIDDELGQVRTSRAAITAKLNHLKTELAKTQTQLETAMKRLRKLTRTLNRRAGSAYKNGDISFLEVLLEAESFGDFLTRARFLQTIMSLDAVLVKNIKKTRNAIENARAEIEKNKNETQKQEDALTVEVNRLSSLSAAQRAKKAEIQNEIGQKTQLVGRIEDDKEAYLAAAAEFERTASKIRRQLAGSIVVGTPSASGFIWPAAGSLTSGFGPRWGRMHEGIDIAAPTGAPVVAAKAGKVIMSGWEGGYGNLVVIDHGGGVSTAYGHNSSLKVSVGQSVSQGQLIAAVGSTGRSTGPHVHFEIRLNGNAVNPLSYLP